MDEEDLLPQRKKPQLKDLSPMAIAELESYIAGLEAEIERASQLLSACHSLVPPSYQE